jgi:hypothetical protein
LKRAPHQNAVDVDHQQHRPQISDAFDWLVIGQVVPRNSAASVRGPSHFARQCKTTVPDATVARSNGRSYWEVVCLAASQRSPTPAFNLIKILSLDGLSVS